MISSKNYKIILFLIIIIGAIIRLVGLNNWPTFTADEAINGYDAYSLLKTGQDHRGNSWPIFFASFSDKIDNRPPIYNYLLVIFIKIFGLNELAVRLPAAILGILTIYIIYLLTKELFEKEEISLLAAFLLALSPWHIFVSRWGVEVVLIPLIFSLALLFLLKAIKINGNKKYLILSSFFWGLLLYTYQPAKILVPFFLFFSFILLILQNKISFKNRDFLISIFLFLLFLLPYFLKINQLPIGRLDESNFVFTHQLPYATLVLFINTLMYSQLPILFEYLITFVFFIFGFYLIFKKIREIKNQLILVGIISSIIPAVIFADNPSIGRAINLVIFLQILAAFALYSFYKFLKEKNKNIIVAILLLIIINLFSIFSFLSFTSSPLYIPVSPVFNLYSFPTIKTRSLFQYIRDNENNYEKIVFVQPPSTENIQLNSMIYSYVLFYLKYSPEKLHALETERIYIYHGWQFVTRFDKYEFCLSNSGYPCDFSKKNSLYVIGKSLATNIKSDEIYYEDFR